MKKFLSLALAGVFIFMCLFFTASAQDIAGDVDSDGFVRAADARIVLRAAVGIETLCEEKYVVADVDNNDVINSADARLILRAAVGLEVLHTHTYNTEITIKDTTCVTDGQKQYVCACLSYKKEIIPATGHKFTDLIVLPTCTQKGYTEHICSTCSYAFSDGYVNPIGHKYRTVVTAPTCTDKGYTTKICTNCSDKIVCDYVNASGHTYKSIVTAPTCTKQGYTTYICSDCSYKFVGNYIKANGHSYSSVVTVPTCTEKGYTTHICSGCSDVFMSDYVKAKVHSYSSVVTAPTCTEKGYTTHICSDCTASYISDYVNAKGHSYETSETLPTCTQKGKRIYVCPCGDTFSENIPAVGHSFEGAVCSVCSEANPDYVPLIEYGSVSGCISFESEETAAADQGAKLLLIPVNDTVKIYDNSLAAMFTQGDYESGIRVRKCDSEGSYNFSSEVSKGTYLLVAVSANSNSRFRLSNENEWNCYVDNLLDEYFSQSEINYFKTLSSYYRIASQEIEVVADTENVICITFEATDF